MKFKQGFALVIGVSDYKHEPRLNVPIASRDVKAVRDVLLNSQFCGYSDDKVISLYDDYTSREHILLALDQVASQTQKDNTVFIFFCGHGDYGTDGNYYLLCNDSRVEGNQVASGTGISQQELLEKLRAIEAQRVVVILNSCHSGEISLSLSIKETFGGKTLPNETAEALMATGSGRILITACREGQLSWIGGGNLSIFSQALIDALQGKDIMPRGGFVSVFDLYTSLYQNVSSQVGDLLGVEQEPELTILKGVGPFAVALFQGATQTNLGVVEEAFEPPQKTAVRQVEPETSNRMYQKIVSQSGGINFGQANKIDIQGSITGGDRVDVSNVKGFVYKPTGPVEQQFGDQINTGGGAFVGGNVTVSHGDFVGRDQYKTVGGSATEMAELFKMIFAKIETHPGLSETDKEDLKADVTDVKTETTKADQIDESFLVRRLRNIQRIAPDILDVVLAALSNPAAGFGVVVRKIAEKMKPSSA
jgi:hypothetical protein